VDDRETSVRAPGAISLLIEIEPVQQVTMHASIDGANEGGTGGAGGSS